MSGAVAEQGQPAEAASAPSAFLAGYDEDDNATQGKPTEESPLPASTADASAPAATPEPSPAPTPAPKFVQVTEDEWNRVQASAARLTEVEATLRKRIDDTHGALGGLNRKLAELQQTTPQGEAVQVDDADFAELATDYPELAALTAKGLNKIIGRLKGGAGMDPEALEKVVNERIEQARKADRAELIDTTLNAIVDGVWQDEVKTPAYQAWEQSQPQEVKALAVSDKLNDAAKLMRLYAKAKNAPAPAPTTPPQAGPSTRQRQVAAAVIPRGDGAAAPPPAGKSPFRAGYDDED